MALNNLTFFIYNTPFGSITIGSNGNEIIDVCLGQKTLSGEFRSTTLTNLCSTQLLQYFSLQRKTFDVPIKIQGTPFQIDVFKGLLNVPFAQTITPEVLSKSIGHPNSHRHISKAAFKNRLNVIIPSHRLVTKSGFERPCRESKVRQALRDLESNATLNK